MKKHGSNKAKHACGECYGDALKVRKTHRVSRKMGSKKNLSRNKMKRLAIKDAM